MAESGDAQQQASIDFDRLVRDHGNFERGGFPSFDSESLQDRDRLSYPYTRRLRFLPVDNTRDQTSASVKRADVSDSFP
jgi:hypothetical protein